MKHSSLRSFLTVLSIFILTGYVSAMGRRPDNTDQQEDTQPAQTQTEDQSTPDQTAPTGNTGTGTMDTSPADTGNTGTGNTGTGKTGTSIPDDTGAPGSTGGNQP